MNMLSNLMGGFVDKEQITKDYITDALELVAKEFGLKPKDTAVMIQAQDEEYNFKMYVIQLENNSPKKLLRELTVKELVAGYEGGDESDSGG